MSGSGKASFLECPALEETPPLNIFRMVPRVNQTPSRSPQELSASKSAPSSLQTERATSKQRKNSVLNSPLDLKIMDSRSSMSRSAPSFKLKQESNDDGNRASVGDSPESKNAMNSNWSASQSDAHFFDLDYFSSDSSKSKRATAQTAPVANALKTKVPSKQKAPGKAPSGNSASLHTSSKKAYAADNSFGSEEERSSGASVADRSMMGPPSLLDDDDTPPSIHTLRNSDFDQSGFGKSPIQSETKYSDYSNHSNVKKEESAGTLYFKKIAGTPSVPQQALKSQINRVSHSPHLENMPRSDSFDPILGALSSLQQEKTKLEYRLSGTMNELSATQSELSSTKALLASLKEKSRGLLTTVRDIGADRDELRRAMDACSANIELARLGIIELRSEVNFSRRRLTEREEMNEDVSMQLQELDKELNRRSMAYQLLQSKFDEKSGLLLEERSKVSALEEKIHQLENERQALVEQHESEKSTALRSIESKLQTVNDDLTKFEGLLDTRFHDYTLRLESIHDLNLEMQDIITTNRDSISKLSSLSSSQKTHIEASMTELQEILRREISEMISQAGALQTLNANLEAGNKTLQCKISEEETAGREKNTRILYLEQEISKALDELAQKVDKGVVLKLEDELSELHKAAESYSQLSAEWKEKMKQSSEKIEELEDELRSKSDTQAHKECQHLLTQQEQHAKELTMACELDKQNAIHSLTSRYDKQMAEMGRTHTASIEAIKRDLVYLFIYPSSFSWRRILNGLLLF
ncbi:hypothetical protein BZA70DRAFT_37067 [Myxozyma melibiosi]|uniref:Up-regulated during septation protein 1 domain-containing protein n=1 Tax=Myxozyma melibiosi TaxID=54550 RepID=A0ABR1FE62_9ASCO